MAETSKTLILKVLSGSQFGVEVTLKDGEYTFGRGPDCDIQFSDISMAAHHGTLRIAGGKLELKAVGAPLHTASGLLIDAGDKEWREIAQLDQVTAGTSVFAIGEPEAQWSKLTQITSAEPSRAGQSVRSSGVVPTILAALAVIGVCVIGIVLLTGEGNKLPLGKKTTPSQDVELVEEAIANLPFRARLNVELQPDGVVNVEGYVNDGAERRAVQNAILETGAPIRRRIWALEALSTDAAGLIANQNINVTHTLKNDGVLELTGIHLNDAAVTNLVRLLETEVFGLARVENKILTAESYLSQVKDLIDKLQLSELVLARLDGQLIETTGVVPVERTDNWVGFMRSYARQYADIIPLRSFVTLEGQPQGNATEPVILSGSQSLNSGLLGRLLNAEELTSAESGDSSVLFAAPTEGAIGSAPSPAQPLSALVSELISGNSDVVDAAIDSFVAENPQVVAGLLRNITNGQVEDIDTLRALFEESLPEEDSRRVSIPSRITASSPTTGDESFSSVSSLARLINAPDEGLQMSRAPGNQGTITGESTAPASGEDSVAVNGESTVAVGTNAPPTETDSIASNRASSPSTSTLPVDIAGFLPVPTFFQATDALNRLDTATQQLFDLSNPATPAPLDDALEAYPQLAQISPELVALATVQRQALSFGETLISPPRPLSAVPDYSDRGRTCWQNSALTVESLPSVLLWMDILSTSGSADLMELEEDSRRIFIEAALSPARISDCLAAMETKFSNQLRRSSIFLQENKRNDIFAGFLLRNVPRYELEIVGTNLTDTRYLQLADGRKLSEGSAPDLATRLTIIGDLGVMLRISGGYQVALFDDAISWSVADQRD